MLSLHSRPLNFCSQLHTCLTPTLLPAIMIFFDSICRVPVNWTAHLLHLQGRWQLVWKLLIIALWGRLGYDVILMLSQGQGPLRACLLLRGWRQRLRACILTFTLMIISLNSDGSRV